MTGPRIDPPKAKHGDPPTPTRDLTYEEWKQAQGMSVKAMKDQPFPAQPPVFKAGAAGRMGALMDGMKGAAPRDVVRTPNDPNVRGKSATEWANQTKGVAGVIEHTVAPVLDHPWMAAGVIGASMLPVVGPYVAGYFAGDAASMVALYGYQRSLEKAASPGARKIMEADPERISGEAAAAQAIMLGLTPLTQIPALRRAVKRLDVSDGMMEAGAKGVKDLTPADIAPESPATLRGDNTYANKRFAAKLEAEAKRQGSPRGIEPLEGLEPSGDKARLTTTPRHPSGYSVDNPFAPENVRARALDVETPAQALDDVAAARNDPMRPRRRVETPEGAEVLGSAAARHGLDVDANPFPPDHPAHSSWKQGHEQATAPVPVNAPAPREIDRSQFYVEDAIHSELLNAPDGTVIGRVATFLKGDKIRALFRDVLDVKVVKLSEPPGGNAAGAEYKGAFGYVGDEPTIFIPAQSAPEFIPSLLEEAAHAMRAKRGRVDEPQTLGDGFDFAAYENLPAEVSARKMVDHALSLREPLPSYPDGFSMGGPEGRIPKVPRQQRITEPDAPPAPPENPLAPIEGTGPIKTRGASLATEAKAVEAGLVETLGDLPQFAQADFAAHAQRAVELLDSDPVMARKIALGEETAPAGMIPEMFERALRNRAIAQGDVATIRELATSKLVGDATTMAQRLAARGYRDPESPVTAIQEVIAAREASVKNVPKATAATIADIRKKLEGTPIPKAALTEIANILGC
jgi:hypothetical protein